MACIRHKALVLVFLALQAPLQASTPGEGDLVAEMQRTWRERVAGRFGVPDVPAMANSAVHGKVHWHTAAAPKSFLPSRVSKRQASNRGTFWVTSMAMLYVITVVLGTAILWGGSRLKVAILGGGERLKRVIGARRGYAVLPQEESGAEAPPAPSADSATKRLRSGGDRLRCLTAAVFVAYYAVAVGAVSLSARSGRLSQSTGLDWELYFGFFAGACLWMLLQALFAVLRSERNAKYSLMAFGMASFSCCIPYVSDGVDTLLDAVLGGLCLLLPHGWHVLGIASLAYLLAAHVWFYFRPDMVNELMNTYFSVYLAPTEAQTVLLAPLVELEVLLYRMTTYTRRYVLTVEEIPQVVIAVTYLAVRSSYEENQDFPWLVVIMKVTVPLANLAFAFLAYKPLLRRVRPWFARELRQAWIDGNRVMMETLLASLRGEEKTLLGPVLRHDPDLAVVYFWPGDDVGAPPGREDEVGKAFRRAFADESEGGADESEDSPLRFLRQAAVHAIVDQLEDSRTASRLSRALGSGKVSVAARKALAEVALQHLRRLDLRDIRLGARAGEGLAKSLKGDSALQVLDLKGNDLGAEAGSALADALKVNASLQHLGLEWNGLDAKAGKALAEALQVNNALKRLNLEGNDLGAEGGKALAEALKVNNALHHLGLEWNGLDMVAGKALADALRVNSALRHLRLERNELDTGAGTALADALRVNSALQHLGLERNELGAEAGKALADALVVNSALQSLGLKLTGLGTEAGKAFAKTLSLNSTLQYLDLGGNELDAEAVEALSAALKVNASLEHLDLERNELGAEAGKALAKALTVNSALKSLSLEWNELDAEAAKALAEALKVNSSLQRLGLKRNKLDTEAVKALAEALKANSSLQHLGLERNKLDVEAVKALAEALKVNSALQHLGLEWNELDAEARKALAEIPKRTSWPRGGPWRRRLQ